uniref:Uncharacterized protein n=2 Tax=Rhodnius prolixus TaxID=13249 RepID=T1I7H3_RHOPR
MSFRPNSAHYNVPWYHKRKLKDEVPADLLPPPKVLITEEKMVSQLKGIHLSKDYTSHGGGSSALAEESAPAIGLEEKQSLPTLVMCDEIRALQKVVAPVLPKHIMDKYRRPTNALVLWQPPVGDLGKYLKTFSHESAVTTDEVMNSERTSQTSTVGDVEMNEDDDNNNSSPSHDLNGFFTRTI